MKEFNQRIETKQIQGEGQKQKTDGRREKTVQITGGSHNGEKRKKTDKRMRWKRKKRILWGAVTDEGGGQRRQDMEGYYE